MRGKKLYKEIGLIDENLIEASTTIEVDKKHIHFYPRWIACALGLMVLSSVSTGVLAREYYENKNKELYMRYLTTEDMELISTYEYDADKFLRALKSENEEYVYIAINRLIESFNNEKLRIKALKEIEPFITSSNVKIAGAAIFATDILSKKYESPFIYKLNDGSIVFTLFNDYSDYGSQNVLWRIKGNKLEEYLNFSTPSIYIKEIIPSPDKKLIAVVTCSNKSEFVQIIDIEEGKVSPELMESARVRYGLERGLETWIRVDHENYSCLRGIEWKDNHALQFKAIMTYNDTQDSLEAIITYDFKEKKIDIK